jgi:hypothetical protein
MGTDEMNADFLKAVGKLVDELNKETASGLISRAALIALDRVHQLLDLVPEKSEPEPAVASEAL